MRLIQSDLKLNIFGESFSMLPELEYAVAAIDVKEQKRVKLRSGVWT